jgi:membrane associated rhomboid family serine protease
MVKVQAGGDCVIIELQYRGHIQQMLYEEFETRVRDGEIPANVPVRFDAVTGDEFVPVGELELYRELLNPQRKAFREKFTRRGIPLFTAILVGIQIRIYLMSWSPGTEEWLQTAWTNWAPGILEQGEVYRLFSYGLLHIGFTHLLFNLTFLAYTGYNLERALGGLNLLLLYFGSVFSGGVLSMWMAPGRPSLGASGGDFGLLAAAVVFGWKHWDDIPIHARTKFGWALAPYLGFSLISGLTAENVDNWGHLGGLAGGALLMTVLSPELSTQSIQRNRWVQRSSAVIALLVSGGLFHWGPQLIPLKDHTEGSWTVPVPTYWREGWTFTGDRGWFSPTGNATMVVTQMVHERPLSNAAAVDTLVERISKSGAEPQVLKRIPRAVGEHDAIELRMRFLLSGEPQEIHAVVLTRGVVTYRTQIQARTDTMERYQPVFERALHTAVLMAPASLQAAKERAATHPRSWQPAVDLGDELYRAGQPEEAIVAYQRALVKVPDQTQAWIGRLKVHTHYSLPRGLMVARQALSLPNPNAKVIVAAADLLDSVGSTTEAQKALDDAWLALPGNGIVRRARLQRGFSVDN